MGQAGSYETTSPLKWNQHVEGFQVSCVLPHSPAMVAGLIPYFDIITVVDNIHLAKEHVMAEERLEHFRDYITSHINQPLTFEVFNVKCRSVREIVCIPSDSWGGESMLGCTIVWTREEAVRERSLHVVAVAEDSPAGECGTLQADRDYIVGYRLPGQSTTAMIDPGDQFLKSVMGEASNVDKVTQRISFLVYNRDDNVLREATVTANAGRLGIAVACGMLHMIPIVRKSSTQSVLPVFSVTVDSDQPAQCSESNPVDPAAPVVAEVVVEEDTQSTAPATEEPEKMTEISEAEAANSYSSSGTDVEPVNSPSCTGSVDMVAASFTVSPAPPSSLPPPLPFLPYTSIKAR